MNVEIRTEATQFPEREYIHGIFFAVYCGERQLGNKYKADCGSKSNLIAESESGSGSALE
jgi:hypothetical protein